MTYIKEIERKVLQILNEDPGRWHDVKTKINEITEFHISDFPQLQEALQSRHVIMRQHPMTTASGVRYVLFTPFQLKIRNLMNILMILLPLAGIVLGIFTNYHILF